MFGRSTSMQRELRACRHEIKYGWLCSLALVMAVATANASAAQVRSLQDEVDLDIEASSLQEALNQLSLQTGWQVLGESAEHVIFEPLRGSLYRRGGPAEAVDGHRTVLFAHRRGSDRTAQDGRRRADACCDNDRVAGKSGCHIGIRRVHAGGSDRQQRIDLSARLRSRPGPSLARPWTNKVCPRWPAP